MVCISYNVHDVHLKYLLRVLSIVFQAKIHKISSETLPFKFLLAFQYFVFLNPHDICKLPVSQSKCNICTRTCLSIYIWHLQATFLSIYMWWWPPHSQATFLSIYMWWWPPHSQATCLSSSTSDCKLISILQATHVSRSICDCNNLQSAADHSDACTEHAPQHQSSKDCSIGTQPQPVLDSNLGQVQSLATWFAAVTAEDGTTQDSITARLNQTFELQKIAQLHDPFLGFLGVPKSYAKYQGMLPCCCECQQRVWSLFTGIKKMAGRSLHAHGVSCCWLLLQCLWRSIGGVPNVGLQPAWRC